MIRKAFVMSVHPGCEAEYVRRHQPIWPELESTLLEHGVHSYSIFLRADTHELFAYVEFQSEAEWEAIASTDVCQRWWVHMSSLMPSHPDHSPISHPLMRFFTCRRLAPKPADRSSSARVGRGIAMPNSRADFSIAQAGRLGNRAGADHRLQNV